MRLPKSWQDCGLYEDEPLRSEFLRRKSAIPSQDDKISSQRNAVLVQKMRNLPGGDKVIQTWLDYAFVPLHSDKSSRKAEVDFFTRHFFVRFQWDLYRDRNRALQVLNDERRKRRFGVLSFPTVQAKKARNSHYTGLRFVEKADEFNEAPAIGKQPGTSRNVQAKKLNLPSGSRSKMQDPISRPLSSLKFKKIDKSHRAEVVSNSSGKKSESATTIISVDSGGSSLIAQISESNKPLPSETKATMRGSGDAIGETHADSPLSSDKHASRDLSVMSALQVFHYPATTPAIGTPSNSVSRKRPGSPLTDRAAKQRVISSTYNSMEPIKQPTAITTAIKVEAEHTADLLVFHATEGSAKRRGRPPRVKPVSRPIPQQSTVDHSGAIVCRVKEEPHELAVLNEHPPISSIGQIIGHQHVQQDKSISVGHEDLAHGDVSEMRPKPPLPKLPPVWAQSRQEVCEAFDWFRSYQGGVYHARDIVKGYLLSAFASSRDRFEHGGKLIISHGGGKSESLHYQNGQIASQPASDQLAQDKSVRALLNNYWNHRPLVLLMDDKYALFPYDLASKDVTYAVLGFYTIAYAWAEYQPANNECGRVVRYKFAFRWCENQGSPWWGEDQITVDRLPIKPKRTEDPQVPSSPRKLIEEPFYDSSVAGMPNLKLMQGCEYCETMSPKVYMIWACLNPECEMFWKHLIGKDYPSDLLHYNPDFLQLQASDPIPPGTVLVPPIPLSSTSNGVLTSYAFTRGLHCCLCGRLSCKYRWDRLECMTCKKYYPMEVTIREASDVWSDILPLSFKDHSMSTISGIIQAQFASYPHEGGKGVVQTFVLPHNRGKIHHIQSRTRIGMKEADIIFRTYQEEAFSGLLNFRRWPMRAHKCRGALLTNYFSHNGEPYQYVGGDANTVPFSTAPTAVIRARDLIQLRIEQALGISAKFNEVLSAAYMERQKMAFHSDNEIGLGPLVAGLSLGSPALIHFRLHARHDPQQDHRGILLTIVLRHGDILVMDGIGVQEYYEHTVVPNNFRIAATARQIKQAHLQSQVKVERKE